LRMGGRITIAALAPLAIGMAADCYVVLSRMFGGSGTAASITAVLVLFSVLSLWFAWPLIERSLQPSRTRHVEDAQPYRLGG
jgi:membrane protein implicated in regulation of membrane protease activity